MLRQVLLNIAFFVPFGVLTRHLLGWRARWCVLAALGVSLLIELTQLTGNWFSYPCAYRIFDADDLIANTLGGALGVALAPLARLLPGQHRAPAGEPQPVRPTRRITAMVVDVVSVLLVGAGIPLGVRIGLQLSGHDYAWQTEAIQAMATIGGIVVLLVIVPGATRATLGQHLVHLRPVRHDGGEPRWYQWLVRAIVGAGSFALLSLPGDIGLTSGTALLAPAWAVLSLVVVAAVDTRGVSGFASGLLVVDDRAPRDAPPRNGTDPRRLGSAVLVATASGYVLIAALVSLAALSPVIGTTIIGIVLVGLVLADLALVGYLVQTSLVTLRREGRSVMGALPLAAVAGVISPVVLLVLGRALDSDLVIVVAVGALAAAGHLALLLGAFAVYGAVYARVPAHPGADAIVVLGSRVFDDRVPPLLAARIDRGLQVLTAELDDGRRPLLVLSGGQGPDETVPEGRAMADLALRHGAPADLVRVEDRSRSTRENLLYSRDLVHADGGGDRLVVATNDYHAFRAAILARELDLDAQVVGAPTARYYFPAALLREFVGVLSRRPALHAGMLLVIAAAGAALAAVALRGPLG